MLEGKVEGAKFFKRTLRSERAWSIGSVDRRLLWLVWGDEPGKASAPAPLEGEVVGQAENLSHCCK